MAWITDKTANHQDASLDDTKVKEILTGKSYVKDGQPGDTSFTTAKGEYVIPYAELYTAGNKEPVVPTTGINYGGKTAQTVELGDEISIDTEKFTVLSNNGTKIKAIPYYNITLSLEEPR